jgi:hypothetical protein
VCPCENYFVRDIETTLSTNPPFEVFSWHTHIGDWWGDAKASGVPGPYDVETPVRFGPDELRALSGGNWKFVYVIRDGRNQMESLRNLPGGIEMEKHTADPKDYFLVLCKAFRNRARLAIDCRSQLDSFAIFRFEDFVSDYVRWMQNVYEYLDLSLDVGFVQRAREIVLSSSAPRRHSSFGAQGDSNKRWLSWTPWERQVFKEIAGKELIELGYETSENW